MCGIRVAKNLISSRFSSSNWRWRSRKKRETRLLFHRRLDPHSARRRQTRTTPLLPLSCYFACTPSITLLLINNHYFLINMSSARAVYRQYSNSSNVGSSENLPPRTLARLAREVRDLHKTPPEGVRLILDDDTGLPSNLGELLVSHGRYFSMQPTTPNTRTEPKPRRDFRCNGCVSSGYSKSHTNSKFEEF